MTAEASASRSFANVVTAGAKAVTADAKADHASGVPLSVAVATEPVTVPSPSSLPGTMNVILVNQAVRLRELTVFIDADVTPHVDAWNVAVDCEWHEERLCLIQLGFHAASTQHPSTSSQRSGNAPTTQHLTPPRPAVVVDAHHSSSSLPAPRIAHAGAAAAASPPDLKSSPDGYHVVVYIIDALAFGPSALRVALTRFFRDPSIRKYTWDCRRDCLQVKAALGIELNGCYDLQLLEVMTRGDAAHPTAATSMAATSSHSSSNASMHTPAHRIVNVFGLKRVLDGIERLRPFVEAKTATTLTRERGSSVIFMTRPLGDDIIAYSAGDVACLFYVLDELRKRPAYSASTTDFLPVTITGASSFAASSFIEHAVLAGSQIYQSVYADTPEAAQRHSMLPLDVLPVSRATGSRCCASCKRNVASRDFCTVCFLATKPQPAKQGDAPPGAAVGPAAKQGDRPRQKK